MHPLHSARLLATAAVVAAGAVLLQPAIPVSASTRGASPAAVPWAGGTSQLAGVSADTSLDAWSVGNFSSDHGQGPRIRHWNGSHWSVVANPGGANISILEAVDTQSQTNAWALGLDSNFTDSAIEHWDGSSWTRVANANPGGSSGTSLTAIDAETATDAWAVGSYNQQSQALAERWNGSSWSQVPVQNPSATSNILTGVSAVSPNDVWAVGTSVDGGGATQALIEHWNGTAWTQVAAPSPGGTNGTFLSGVSFTSPTDGWAVGEYGTGPTYLGLTEHWDGTSWTVIPNPTIGPNAVLLRSVSAVVPSEAWAVGQYNRRSIIEFWDGTAWNLVRHPSPRFGSALFSVSAIAFDQVWAVGGYRNGNKSLTLLWDGARWQRS